MAKPKLNVYDMAVKGVNVTEDPIHLTDGELVQAQNIQIDPVIRRGAVRKRDGMTRINGSALAGAVTGICALPLPDLSALPNTIYEAWDDAGGSSSSTFRTSSNGTVWTTVAVAAKPQEASKLGTAIAPTYMAQRYATLNNKLYYPGNDYTSTGANATQATIHVWDGTTDYVLALIPISPLFNYGTDRHGVINITPYSPELLLVSTYDGDGATGRGRVMILDITTGQVTQLGVETSIIGAPIGLHIFNGRIYVGTFTTNLTLTKLYWVRLGDAAMTDTGMVLVAGEGVTDLVTFLGDLYIGTSAAWPAANPINSHIKKFTNSTAVFSNAATNGGTATGNQWGPFILSSDGLTCFTFYTDRAGGPDTSIKKSTDGATWTADYDIDLNLGNTFQWSGRPARDSSGNIYWPIFDASQNGKILKRTSAGVWSIADNTAAITIRGPLNIIQF